jgi:FkbM family methyltransferase
MTPIPQEELEVFKSLKDINIVFDVGCRTDTEYYDLRPDLEYHLFEPNPEFYNQIKLTSNTIINNYGLGDKEEYVEYFPYIQSFSLVEWRGHGGDKYLVKTLDSYGVVPDFLKIDTEGYDYKVLLGATKSLPLIKYIQFEYWDGVRKFAELLADYDLFLIKEPRLLASIRHVTQEEKYEQLLTPLTEDVIDLIDNKMIPKYGSGGNILAIHK